MTRTARRWAIAVAAVLAAVAAPAWWTTRRIRASFTADAVMVIAMELRDQPLPPAGDLDALVERLGGCASVIAIGRAPDGRPADAWGTPYRVERRADGATTCTSAGPNGRFGDGDDIAYAQPAPR